MDERDKTTRTTETTKNQQIPNDANGVILYQGPSNLDNQPIVVIATGLKTKSSNAKTGAMVQTYILRSDIPPTEAIQTGEDASICGGCPHRGQTVTVNNKIKNIGRTCYVNVGQGPRAVYDAYTRNLYPTATKEQAAALLKDRYVRIGTYGDPMAAPAQVWLGFIRVVAGWTAYTHQWDNAVLNSCPAVILAFQAICMASVDSEEEMREAHARGWRTFRVGLLHDTQVRKTEALCPASAEAGRKLQCAQCLACSGRGFGGGADGSGRVGRSLSGSIYIPAHGGFAVMANVKKVSLKKLGEAA